METTSNRRIVERVAADRVEAVNAELLGARWEADFLTKAAADRQVENAQAPRP